MRKLFSVFIVICIVTSSFIFVNAAGITEDISSRYFDVVTYTGKNLLTDAWTDFSLPGNTSLYYIDVIFSCNGFSYINFGLDGKNETRLSVESIGTDSNGRSIYRAFGNVNLTSSTFSLRVGRTDPTVYFYQIHIYNLDTIKTAIRGGCQIASAGFTGTPIVFNPTDTTNSRSWTGVNNSGYNETYLRFYPNLDDWKGYDYIDFLLHLELNDINSISCMFDEIAVPFEVSYIESGYTGANMFLINIRIDVRGLDKSINDIPYIDIIGHESFTAQNVVDILEISGLVFIDDQFSFNWFWYRFYRAATVFFNNVGTWISNQTSAIGGFFSNLTSSLSNWFTTLFSDLNDIKNALTGTVEDGEEIQQNIDNSKQEMQDYKDAMESLPVPDIDDVDLDLDDNSGNAAITSVGRVLAIGINNEVTLPIFMLLFTFSMVGYALYGKR